MPAHKQRGDRTGRGWSHPVALGLLLCALTAPAVAEPARRPPPRPLKVAAPPAPDPLPEKPDDGVPGGADADRRVPLPAAGGQASRPPVRLSMEESCRLALANHASLRSAVARLEQSAQQVEMVAAPARPQLTFSASIQRIQQPAGPPVVATFPTIPGLPPVTQTFQPQGIEYSQGQVDLTIRQLLFDGGKIEERIEEARSSSQSAEQGVVAAYNQLDLQVRLAYLDALQARAQQRVARESLDLARDQLAAAEARFKAGTAPRADTVYARVPVARAELELTRSRLGVATSQSTLDRLLGLPQDTPLGLDEPEPVGPVPGDLEQCIREGLARRPEVRARQVEVEAANHGLEAAYHDNAPQFYAVGDVNAVGYNDSFIQPDNEGWKVGLEIRWPILEGNRKAHLVTQAEARLRECQAQLEDQGNNAELEIRKAYAEVETTAQAFRTAQAQVDQAYEALRMAQGQYRAGVAPFLQVSEAQVNFLQARTSRLAAYYDYLRARARLSTARGDKPGAAPPPPAPPLPQPEEDR